MAEILAAAHDGQRPCGITRALLDQRLNEISSVISELADNQAGFGQTLPDARHQA